jgi:hypothetical protein
MEFKIEDIFDVIIDEDEWKKEVEKHLEGD